MKKNTFFTSPKEKTLWLWAVVVLMAIYASLFLGGQLLDLMVERHIIEQSTFYLFLVLIVAFILSGLKSKKKRMEYWIYAGVIAVYGMALLRMDLSTAERSHMFEYGLFAVLIYEALLERKRNGAQVPYPIVLSIMIAGTVGLLDEVIQYVIPYRVFDVVDIGFNYIAAAIGVLFNIGAQKLHLIFSKWNE
ncbi:VanZ family protein [Aureisphaera sp. CAU 1614]|uniref:VanZ family protein n=1 Tax=Halomarinibacterium sedimenti TaxID=2857106 RepID=A0A9X1FPD7_9FLAO|nr:VanZ family protein [Halomarinibacterium sedimenti]MBW2938100.1 VanZ family protein [Halomarinibacterium sedimenti]